CLGPDSQIGGIVCAATHRLGRSRGKAPIRGPAKDARKGQAREGNREKGHRLPNQIPRDTVAQPPALQHARSSGRPRQTVSVGLVCNCYFPFSNSLSAIFYSPFPSAIFHSQFSMMSFRCVAAILAALGVIADRAAASVILHEGDVFTYEFNALPDALHLPPGFGSTDGGGFSLRVSEFDSQQDVLRFEMFEDNLAHPAFLEAVVEAVTDGSFLEGTWADHQGVVRLT